MSDFPQPDETPEPTPVELPDGLPPLPDMPETSPEPEYG